MGRVSGTAEGAYGREQLWVTPMPAQVVLPILPIPLRSRFDSRFDSS